MARFYPVIDLAKWAKGNEYDHILYIVPFLEHNNIGIFCWGKDLIKYAYLIDDSGVNEIEKWNYLVFTDFINNVKLISKQETYPQLIVDCFIHLQMYEHNYNSTIGRSTNS